MLRTARSLIEEAERRGARALVSAGLAGLLAVASGLAAPALFRVSSAVVRTFNAHAIIAYVLTAALSFTIGGIFMKLSEGLTKPIPSACLLVCFLIGACLQTLAMRGGELGVIYIVVLGVEAVLAFTFGCLLFNEQVTLVKSGGILAILIGIVALRH